MTPHTSTHTQSLSRNCILNYFLVYAQYGFILGANYLFVVRYDTTILMTKTIQYTHTRYTYIHASVHNRILAPEQNTNLHTNTRIMMMHLSHHHFRYYVINVLQKYKSISIDSKYFFYLGAIVTLTMRFSTFFQVWRPNYSSIMEC